ncbi:hypothetical protein [Thalassolituus maritimus]|nr:hypothetical protein [Thalassolituus maritimus]
MTVSACAANAGPSMQELEQRIGLASIGDDNMQNISAQGINEDSQYLIDLGNNTGPDDEGGLKTLMVLFQTGLPLLNFVGDYEINGVSYDDPDGPRSIVNEDGSISLVLPSNIDEIAYRNMTIGETNTDILGDLYFRNISTVPDSTVTLIPRTPEP